MFHKNTDNIQFFKIILNTLTQN